MSTILQIDNKLLALRLNAFAIFNITDSLPNHTIRKIIYNNDRFIILTTTKLFHLYINQGFKLKNLTNKINTMVDINSIKFISNSYFSCRSNNDFAIYLNDGTIYICKISYRIFDEITKYKQLNNIDIIAIPNEEFGYIHKDGNKYIIEQFNNCGYNKKVCSLDALPTNFMTPSEFLCDGQLMDYKFKRPNDPPYIVNTKVEHIYNKYYYTKNNTIYRINTELSYGNHETDSHKVITIYGNYKIMSTVSNQTKFVEYHIYAGNGYVRNHEIACFHYCAINLGQYSNDVVGIGWSTINHHLFDDYVSKFVNNIMMCHKYGKLKVWIPKGVLFLIIQQTVDKN